MDFRRARTEAFCQHRGSSRYKCTHLDRMADQHWDVGLEEGSLATRVSHWAQAALLGDLSLGSVELEGEVWVDYKACLDASWACTWKDFVGFLISYQVI